MENINKSIKVKPNFYSICFENLKQIANEMGYNLVLHGSLNRDMDLIAIPWIDEPKTHIELIQAFCEYLGVQKFNDKEQYMYSVLDGGRHSYVINLNRGGSFNSYLDAQYYLDISITPLCIDLKNNNSI